MALIGLAKSALHYRRNPRPGVADPVAHRDRRQPSAITDQERAWIIDQLNANDGVPVE